MIFEVKYRQIIFYARKKMNSRSENCIKLVEYMNPDSGTAGTYRSGTAFHGREDGGGAAKSLDGRQTEDKQYCL